jgi:hypothetical protein
MLEDEPQTPATVRASIDKVDVSKSLVLAEGIIVAKTFFGFLRFDVVLAQSN